MTRARNIFVLDEWTRRNLVFVRRKLSFFEGEEDSYSTIRSLTRRDKRKTGRGSFSFSPLIGLFTPAKSCKIFTPPPALSVVFHYFGPVSFQFESYTNNIGDIFFSSSSSSGQREIRFSGAQVRGEISVVEVGSRWSKVARTRAIRLDKTSKAGISSIFDRRFFVRILKDRESDDFGLGRWLNGIL